MITVHSREDFLNMACAYVPKNCYAAELGVFEGDFSAMILDVINPYSLFLIDPYSTDGSLYPSGSLTAYSSEDQYRKVIERFESDKRVKVHRAFSYDAKGDYPDNYFDLVYVDASHTYPHAKRDLTDWLPKMKPDALLCGHDYIEHEDFGVIEAVNEFCIEHNFQIIILNESGGDFALKRK